MVELNSIIHRAGIIDIYRLLHPTAAAHTFFSSSQGTFTQRDHILGYKIYLTKFKKVEII